MAVGPGGKTLRPRLMEQPILQVADAVITKEMNAVSQSTARKSRQQNGSAVEKLPDLEDFLGLDDLASIEADRIRNMAVRLRLLNRQQEDEELKDTDPIPNVASEEDGEAEVRGLSYRSFRQQRALIKGAFSRTWKKIDEEGFRALVEQKLSEAKSR